LPVQHHTPNLGFAEQHLRARIHKSGFVGLAEHHSHLRVLHLPHLMYQIDWRNSVISAKQVPVLWVGNLLSVPNHIVRWKFGWIALRVSAWKLRRLRYYLVNQVASKNLVTFAWALPVLHPEDLHWVWIHKLMQSSEQDSQLLVK
jgi:hypothetical protein